MAQVKTNTDGSVDITFHVEAEQVLSLRFAHVDFDVLSDAITEAALQDAHEKEYQEGLNLYQLKRQGAKDKKKPFTILDVYDQKEISDWFRGQEEYENAADAAIRIKEEKEAAILKAKEQLEAKQAEIEAAKKLLDDAAEALGD